jgi:hypothetical protein
LDLVSFIGDRFDLVSYGKYLVMIVTVGLDIEVKDIGATVRLGSLLAAEAALIEFVCARTLKT